jgi:hypothetical protein
MRSFITAFTKFAVCPFSKADETCPTVPISFLIKILSSFFFVAYVFQVAAFLHAFSRNPFKLLFSDIYKTGKALANYPQALAQDAVCHSHTGHMTGLWFLSVRPLMLNTNE